MRLHLASRNAKKIGELNRILGPLLPGLDVVGLDDVATYAEPVEDGSTFADNALIKARAGFAATGLPTVADDSGLCVDALNGMPGVLSARWAGPPRSDTRNNALVLAQLEDVADERRGAGFACAIAYVDSDREIVVSGEMRGTIRRAITGEGGFGYDPMFEPAEAPGRTSAELTPAEKDAISHRGHALRALAEALRTV
ncbi:non-canonical purine NTP pyrophosphatase [Nocardioides baekrokdamisoli]|uniref:dITP/XTP pyrophosphatase n=1 Tax=Nocardioides baekrokdamisoli TaxID=1804624 RepID=A0A3G9IWF0_9ACTN|nr:RdgB/HAM1 family non-canonical purine NTP pyrophosphatase [Nocardioides baekrokdamisoli]BBH16673.1 non-canonical purine NTP pyrophosphatase [Nocardioides baekrokdamisoli]